MRRYSHLLDTLIRRLAPAVVVAVGRKAELAASELEMQATYVRHPSNGGSQRFKAKMKAITRELCTESGGL
jgi:hypothetical protein